jgi:head-tail adaptor
MKSIMSASDLDEKITIKRPMVTQHPVYKTRIETWVPIESEPGSPTVGVKLSAQVQHVLPSKTMSAENEQGGILLGRSLARIRIWYRTDVTSEMQVTHHVDDATEVIYNIIAGPAVIGHREGLEFMCERFTS